MPRMLQASLLIALLAGCASVPPPTERSVMLDAPWGLAWIPSRGEVAINEGAIEHVLYPNANAAAQVKAPATELYDFEWALSMRAVPSEEVCPR